MGKFKRILLGVVVMALCLTLFAGQSPYTGAQIPDEPAVTKQVKDDSGADSDSDKDPTVPDDKPAVTTAQTMTGEPAVTSEIPPVSTIISIKFGSCTLFKDRRNRLVLKDSDDLVSQSETVETDSGENVTISCVDGKVTFTNSGTEITSFSYGGKTVELHGGQVYYGGELLEYKDTSFHSYDLTGMLTVNLDAAGRYKLFLSGEETGEAKIYDNDGRRLTITVADDGKSITVTNEQGERVDSFKLGGVDIKVTGQLLYIGGKALTKEHSGEVLTSATTKETEAATSETSESGGQGTTAATGGNKDTQKTVAKTTTKAAATTTTSKATAASTTKSAPTLPYMSPTSLAAISAPGDGRNVNITEYKDYTAQMLPLINQARAASGLSALKADPTGKMFTAAKIRAEEYAYYPNLIHTRPNARGGGKYVSVFGNAGMQVYLYMTKYSTQVKNSMYEFSYASGENLANGFNVSSGGFTDADPQWAFNKWMNSSSHRANILKKDVEYLGVCRVTATEIFSGVSVTKHYWVMLVYKEEIK